MKKLVIAALMLTAGVASAQNGFLRFGIKGGANFSNVQGDVEQIDFNTKTSYHIGALVEVRLFDNLSVQPELLYSVQGSKVEHSTLGKEDFDSKYVNLPIMLKFYLISNRLSIEAGPQFGFMIDDNWSDQYNTRSFDFSVGGGLAFDLTKNIFVQARYMAGMTEFSKEADIKNSNFQLSAGLKF